MTFVPDLAYNNMTSAHVGGQDVQLPIDWSTVSPLPDAVITKVSELGFTDPSFVPNWHGTGALSIPRAGYHFFHNGQLFWNSARQAKVFAQALLAQGIKDNDYFVLDNEEKDSHGNPLVSIAESLDWFYNVLVALGLTDYSRFWLYSTADILNNLNLSKLNNAQLAILKEINIWVAGYPANPPTGGDLVSLPAAYTPDPAIFGPVIGWQYEENAIVPTIPGGVDLNQIAPSFLAKWKAGTVVTPVPAPAPAPAPTPAPTPLPGWNSITINVSADGQYTVTKV